MSTDFYLLPKSEFAAAVPAGARAWVEQENRQFGKLPSVLDPGLESRKRQLADLLLKMNPGFSEFAIHYDEIAQAEKLSVEDTRRKYRYLEINGPGIQFNIFDRHVVVRVYRTMSAHELNAGLFALATAGGFLLFDPQANELTELGAES